LTTEEPEKRSRRACPYCGEPLSVGFGDLLPTRGRGGPSRVKCASCGGKARVASLSQVIGVLGFVVGLLVGAALGAHFASAQSEHTTLYVLGAALAGGFFLAFVSGYAFLRFEPDTPPPELAKAKKRGKKGSPDVVVGAESAS
jgi:hypothetical protein